MMNWLDIVLGGILALSIFTAFRNGLVREITRLLALLVGIVGGMWFCTDVAIHFEPYTANHQVAVFAAFMAILIGALLSAGPVAWGVGRLLGWTGMTGVDRILGGAFGLLRGMLVAVAVVLAVLSFTPTAGSTEAVARSRLAPLVLNGARAATAVAPADLQVKFSEGFQRVRDIWLDKAAVQMPEPPPLELPEQIVQRSDAGSSNRP